MSSPQLVADRTSEALIFNGLDGASGEYLTPPLTPKDVSQLARGVPLDPDHLVELQRRHQRETEKTYAPVEGVDPKDLASTGWGVIFASNADPAVKDALKELLDHR